MIRKMKGFTLIELLIVVAIIAILAAIAVPNFLEAQTRAKVSRVKSDQRTIATAMESYMVDNNNYPEQVSFALNGYLSTISLMRLTTPVAFLSSLGACIDVFNLQLNSGTNINGLQNGQPYLFANWDQFYPIQGVTDPRLKFKAWTVVSFGPDHLNGTAGNTANSRAMIQAPAVPQTYPGGLTQSSGGICWYDCIYDPSNGTVSLGDIGRAGGMLSGEAAALFSAQR